MFDQFDPPQRRWLEEFARSGRYDLAAKASGSTRAEALSWRRGPGPFRDAFEVARELALETTADTLTELAHKGWTPALKFRLAAEQPKKYVPGLAAAVAGGIDVTVKKIVIHREPNDGKPRTSV